MQAAFKHAVGECFGSITIGYYLAGASDVALQVA